MLFGFFLFRSGHKVIRFSDVEVLKDMKNIRREIAYWIEEIENNPSISKDLLLWRGYRGRSDIN